MWPVTTILPNFSASHVARIMGVNNSYLSIEKYFKISSLPITVK
jgi:hypothetical protein